MQPWPREADGVADPLLLGGERLGGGGVGLFGRALTPPLRADARELSVELAREIPLAARKALVQALDGSRDRAADRLHRQRLGFLVRGIHEAPPAADRVA